MKNAGIPVVVVSNNNSERVARAVAPFGLKYVHRALKPFSRGIKQGYQLAARKEKVVMIGDQIMTDVRGANRAGVRSILVKPVIPTDSWKTQFNRAAERKIMNYLLKHNPELKWRGEFNMTEGIEEIHCIGCGAVIQTTNPNELGYTQSALEKDLNQEKSIVNAASVCAITMRSKMFPYRR